MLIFIFSFQKGEKKSTNDKVEELIIYLFKRMRKE